jgi:thiamine-phosphate pyrophosphorylase
VRDRAPRVMAITAGAVPGGAFATWLELILDSSVDAVQIREKLLDDRRCLALALQARAALPERIAVLINGRADVCLAAGANGVHLPSDGLEARATAGLLGRRGLIGRSTHRAEEVERAREEGVDYVTFGPVFSTPGKPPWITPVGLDGLNLVTGLGLPVLALGGITSASRQEECLGAGAWGIAGIRLFDRLRQDE